MADRQGNRLLIFRLGCALKNGEQSMYSVYISGINQASAMKRAGVEGGGCCSKLCGGGMPCFDHNSSLSGGGYALPSATDAGGAARPARKGASGKGGAA